MRLSGKRCNPIGLVHFATDWGTVFAIQGDIEDTGAKLLQHFGLQLEAFDHAGFDTAVMVAYGQKVHFGLGTQQNFPWMRRTGNTMPCAHYKHTGLIRGGRNGGHKKNG